MVRLSRAPAALLLLATAAAAADPAGHPVANAALDELSGLVVSRADPTVLWGHNDTGSGPVLYRIGLDGADLGSLAVPEAKAGDWEDIAAFEDAGGPALLVADVGDNFGVRSLVTLYAVRDPGRRDAPAELLWRLELRFPGGPRDCEAVAVDPDAREILLVSKRERPPRLYRLPLPERPPQKTLIAEAVGTLPGLPQATLRERTRRPLEAPFFHAPTALDIAADGASAILLTPRRAYRFRRPPGVPWRDVLVRAPHAVVALPYLEQAEAAALTRDGRTLYVGSEGRPSRIAPIALPALD